MNRLTVYDLVILQQYFTSKKKKTSKDRELAAKLDTHLTAIVEGLQQWKAFPDGNRPD